MSDTSLNNSVRPSLAWILVAVATSGFIAAFISLQAGFFTLLFTAFAWYVWRYPEEGFLLLLILMPILPMFKITQTIGTFSLVKDVIIITLFVRLFLLPLFQRKLPYRRNILLAPILVLIAWSSIQALRADSLIFGAVLLRDIILYILGYFAVLYLPHHDKKVMQKRLFVVAAVVGVTILLAVWQWFFAQDSAVLRFDPARSIWIPRLSSVLAHPSIYGQYLTAVLVIFGGVGLATKERRTQLLAGIGGAILLPAIFLTYSRGVWLAVAAAGLTMALLFAWNVIQSKVSLKKVGTYGGSIAIVVIAALFIIANTTPAGGLLRSIVDPTYGSNQERVTFLTRLVAPLTNTQAMVGVGLGNILVQNFRSVNLDAIDIASAATRTVQLAKNSTLVDNQHLKTFIEMGLVGLLIYGWLYMRIASSSIRLAISNSEIMEKSIGFACTGFLVAFLLQGFLIDIWNIFPTNALFWIFAALLSQAVPSRIEMKN